MAVVKAEDVIHLLIQALVAALLLGGCAFLYAWFFGVFLGVNKMISDFDAVLRLVLALLLGGVVGYERQSCNKSAGLRTHVLVCVGSCLIMILSVNIYHTVQGLTNADPARLAAQVVSGIGFLGAGTIMKEGPTVKGLTTAASIWVVSGIGLAVGSGYYFSALAATGLVFVTLSVLFRIEKRMGASDGDCNFVVSIANTPGQVGRVCSCLGDSGMNIRDIKFEEEEDHCLLMSISVSAAKNLDHQPIVASLMQVEGVSDVRVE